MSKNLTGANLEVLGTVKKLKGQAITSRIAANEGLSHNGAAHHLKALKKAGKVTRDKKTLVWSAK